MENKKESGKTQEVVEVAEAEVNEEEEEWDDRRRTTNEVMKEVTWTQNKFVKVGKKK